ncbi:MAG: hypothetical protein AB3N23_22340 [Paracoccaceae bacterium]
MTDKRDTFETLDELFAEARDPEPSDQLIDRVLADAAEVQAGFEDEALPFHAPSLFAQVREALGGWAGLGGLATACAAGLWIGIAPPSNWADPVVWISADQTTFDLFQGEDVALLLDGEGE